jgi:hypothetical protein
MMKFDILRVMGIRSKDPVVLVKVDGLLVKWTSRSPWTCECLTDDDDFECIHIETVRGMMDERVLTPFSFDK